MREAPPVYIDTEYDTWNMDPAALEKAFEIYPDVKINLCVCWFRDDSITTGRQYKCLD